jgi:FtsH-binding integral membrane protein
MSANTSPRTTTTRRGLPPIAWLSTLALACVVVGGILLASYAPRDAPFDISMILLIAGAVLLVTSFVLLSQLKDFAWSTFFKVFKWELLAYIVVAGMIELAFVRDHVRGSSLVIVTLMLVIFALAVPTTAAFTTARFADPEQ